MPRIHGNQVYNTCLTRENATRLITRSARSGLSLALQAQQNLFEPGKIGGASSCARNSLALGILQLNKGADTFPGGAG